jgi:hypothetical protein
MAEKALSRHLTRTWAQQRTSSFTIQEETGFERDFHAEVEANYSHMKPYYKVLWKSKLKKWFALGGKLQPFRLLKQDVRNIRERYVWIGQHSISWSLQVRSMYSLPISYRGSPLRAIYTC